MENVTFVIALLSDLLLECSNNNNNNKQRRLNVTKYVTSRYTITLIEKKRFNVQSKFSSLLWLEIYCFV